jgi:NADH-quinone oxidoreductase subunit L
MTFFGEMRTTDAHPHESLRSMRAPLIILALLSICGGRIGIESFSVYLAPSVGLHPAASSTPHLEFILTIVAVLAALEGWLIADKYYRRKTERPAQLAAALPAGYKLLANKYYVDELYDAVLVKPLFATSRYVLGWIVDTAILGGIAWLLAGIANLSGMILQRWQSGNLRSYAAWLTAAAAVVLLFVFHASIGTYLGARGIDVQLNLHWMGH